MQSSPTGCGLVSGAKPVERRLPTRVLLLRCHRCSCQWYSTETLVTAIPLDMQRDVDRCPECTEPWSVSIAQTGWRDIENTQRRAPRQKRKRPQRRVTKPVICCPGYALGHTCAVCGRAGA